MLAQSRPAAPQGASRAGGDRRGPLIELGLEIHAINKRPSRQDVPLPILHARFDLARGLGPIGPAHAGLQAPRGGKGFDGGSPAAPPRLIRRAHRPRVLIARLLRGTTEMPEGLFMGFAKWHQPLIGTGVIRTRGG